MKFEKLSILSIEENQLHFQTPLWIANMASHSYADTDTDIKEHLYSIEDIDCMSRELIPDYVNKDIEAIEALMQSEKCEYFRFTEI